MGVGSVGGSFVGDAHDVIGDVCLRPSCREPSEDAEIDEAVEIGAGGVERACGLMDLRLLRIDDWVLEQEVGVLSESGRCFRGLNGREELFFPAEQRSAARDCAAGLCVACVEAEVDPSDPVAACAHVEQALDIAVFVLFEVFAEMKPRSIEREGSGEHEGEDEASDAAVAVEEGMDGFELVVGEEGGDGAVDIGGRRVGEGNELVDVLFDEVCRRWDKAGVGADLDLGLPKLTRELGVAADATKKGLVHLADEVLGKPVVEEGLGGVGGSPDVVEDLLPGFIETLVWGGLWAATELEEENLLGCGNGAFEGGGSEGFLAEEWAMQDFGVSEQA